MWLSSFSLINVPPLLAARQDPNANPRRIHVTRPGAMVTRERNQGEQGSALTSASDWTVSGFFPLILDSMGGIDKKLLLVSPLISPEPPPSSCKFYLACPIPSKPIRALFPTLNHSHSKPKPKPNSKSHTYYLAQISPISKPDSTPSLHLSLNPFRLSPPGFIHNKAPPCFTSSHLSPCKPTSQDDIIATLMEALIVRKRVSHRSSPTMLKVWCYDPAGNLGGVAPFKRKRMSRQSSPTRMDGIVTENGEARVAGN